VQRDRVADEFQDQAVDQAGQQPRRFQTRQRAGLEILPHVGLDAREMPAEHAERGVAGQWRATAPDQRGVQGGGGIGG
jgi:hypothetical protein